MHGAHGIDVRAELAAVRVPARPGLEVHDHDPSIRPEGQAVDDAPQHGCAAGALPRRGHRRDWYLVVALGAVDSRLQLGLRPRAGEGACGRRAEPVEVLDRPSFVCRHEPAREGGKLAGGQIASHAALKHPVHDSAEYDARSIA